MTQTNDGLPHTSATDASVTLGADLAPGLHSFSVDPVAAAEAHVMLGLDFELYPTDGELVVEIRRMLSETFGMTGAESDARMAKFNYTAAASLIGG